MAATGLSSATCMLCSGRPNCWHLIFRSTSGLLDGGAAAADDGPRNDAALLCRLEMPIVGGADPKEKGLGEGAGVLAGSSGMVGAFLLALLGSRGNLLVALAEDSRFATHPLNDSACGIR